jgi:signal transduction histidine kinase
MAKEVLLRLRSRALPILPFVLIAALFAAGDVLAVRQARESRSEARQLVENMLASVQLVTRMSHDIEHKHLLLNEHILENDPQEMAKLEGEMGATDADYAAAAREYRPLVTLPGEADEWQHLQSETAALAEPVRQELALARENRDGEALRALLALKGRFAAIDDSAATLVTINRKGAEDTVERVREMQRSSAGLLQTFGLFGMGLSLAVGSVTTGLLRRRQMRAQRYSAMLEERNRDLDAFAGRVAHDLRGPLSTMTLAASQVARGAPGESGSAGVLQRTAGRMEGIVGDLLALARIGQSTTDAICDPSSAAAQVREALGPREPEEGVTLRVDVAPARVRCTESFLHQVLFNLVDNAIKYRRPDVTTVVEIRGRPCDRSYELCVSDNGEGMSTEDAHRAFEPLFRAQRTRQRPGSGLGLSIVKRVVEASGGTITVDSQLGQGTTFRTRLPLAGEAPPDAGAPR